MCHNGVMNEETRKKISETLKRRGIKPPSNSGKHFTSEHVAKIIQAKRDNCSLYHSLETTRKIQEKRRQHYDLIGRRSSARDRLEGTFEYQNWRKKILSIGKCEKCGVKNGLQTHHKVPLRDFVKRFDGDVERMRKCSELFDVNLGMALCHKCHRIEDAKI